LQAITRKIGRKIKIGSEMGTAGPGSGGSGNGRQGGIFRMITRPGQALVIKAPDRTYPEMGTAGPGSGGG